MEALWIAIIISWVVLAREFIFMWFGWGRWKWSQENDLS